MNEVKSMEQYVELVQGEKPVVFIFSADWCPDCRFLDRFIEDVVQSYSETFLFYKVNRDEHPALAETLDILGIPSFVVFHGGKVVGRFISKLRKTQAEVEAFLNQVKAEIGR